MKYFIPRKFSCTILAGILAHAAGSCLPKKIQWHGAIIAFTVAGQLPVLTVFPIISSMETLMVVKEHHKYTDEVKRNVSTSLFF